MNGNAFPYRAVARDRADAKILKRAEVWFLGYCGNILIL